MRQLRQHLAGRRIDDVLALAAVAGEPLAVDVKREIGVHAQTSLLPEGIVAWLSTFTACGHARITRPEIRPAVHVDGLPGDVARAGPAEERDHGRRRPPACRARP